LKNPYKIVLHNQSSCDILIECAVGAVHSNKLMPSVGILQPRLGV